MYQSNHKKGLILPLSKVFSQLLKCSILKSEFFLGMKKKNNELSQEIENLLKKRNLLEDEEKSILSEKNENLLFHENQISNKKELIISEMRKHKRDEEKINLLLQDLDKLEYDFALLEKESVDKLTENKKKQVDLNIAYDKAKEEREGLVCNVVSRKYDHCNHNREPIEVLLFAYIFSTQVTSAKFFLNGSYILRTVYCKVPIDSKDTTHLAIGKILEFVPKWEINRIIYLLILSESIWSDDIYSRKENYRKGAAKELFESFLIDGDIWTPRTEKLDDYLQNLEEWLIKPLPTESLITDPIFLRFSEKKHSGGIFLGGNSFTHQVIEFLNYTRNNLKQIPI